MDNLNEQELAEEISNLLNNMSIDAEKVGVGLTTIHRTLQQTFMRVAMAFIIAQADKHSKGHFDLRNRATCELASRIVSHLTDLEKEHNPSLPLI